MREKFMITVLIIAAAMTEIFPGVSAQDAAGKAQQLIAQARAALGGDKLKSLSVTGNYRRTFGQMEMAGEVSYDLLLPDKMMKTETMNPMPSLEITRVEALNGEDVWEDQQQHGGGGGMMIFRRGPGGPGADPQKAKEALQQSVRSDFARLAIGWLLTTPSSFPVEYSFAGEAESPDGKADVLDVKGPGGFAIRLFLDQKTHRPLMLTYNARKPRIITQTAAPGPHRNPGGDGEEDERDGGRGRQTARRRIPHISQRLPRGERRLDSSQNNQVNRRRGQRRTGDQKCEDQPSTQTGDVCEEVV